MSIVNALVDLFQECNWSIDDEDYDTLIWHEDNTVEKPTLAVLQARADELIAEQPMKDLRAARNELLADTDWWAVSDRTMTAEETAYRQALRDLPANTTDPANPTWPTKPS